jgi:hypothetical protein
VFRLNVAAGQYDECVRLGMFALAHEPRIASGELLLLQLNKGDWKSRDTRGGRIRYALVFQRAEPDPEGHISRAHWPDAGRSWPWILYASAVLNVDPFSLEDLPLARKSHYQSQANPVRIDISDEAVIMPFLKWETMEPVPPSAPLAASPTATPPTYANADDMRAVEAFSVARAKEVAAKWFPSATIDELLHNNPGFDLVARQEGYVIRYLEVKGTRSSRPVFFLTECERRFSAENADLYTLVVISNINLNAGTCEVDRHDGQLDSLLRPAQYRGELQR